VLDKRAGLVKAPCNRYDEIWQLNWRIKISACLALRDKKVTRGEGEGGGAIRGRRDKFDRGEGEGSPASVLSSGRMISRGGDYAGRSRAALILEPTLPRLARRFRVHGESDSPIQEAAIGDSSMTRWRVAGGIAVSARCGHRSTRRLDGVSHARGARFDSGIRRKMGVPNLDETVVATRANAA